MHDVTESISQNYIADIKIVCLRCGFKCSVIHENNFLKKNSLMHLLKKKIGKNYKMSYQCSKNKLNIEKKCN